MRTTETTPTLADVCKELGLTIQSTAPVGSVDEENRKWPHLLYQVTVATAAGKILYDGPWKAGLGVHKVTPDQLQREALAGDGSLLSTMARNPHAQLKDHRNLLRWAQLHALAASRLGFKPKLEDVVHSVISDGAAWFNHQTFEDWCGDSREDTDSRKAERTFQACRAIGERISKALSRAEIDRLVEAASNH